jgi:hypothetical protein
MGKCTKRVTCIRVWKGMQQKPDPSGVKVKPLYSTPVIPASDGRMTLVTLQLTSIRGGGTGTRKGRTSHPSGRTTTSLRSTYVATRSGNGSSPGHVTASATPRRTGSPT